VVVYSTLLCFTTLIESGQSDSEDEI
jgi:hypothetical protein